MRFARTVPWLVPSFVLGAAVLAACGDNRNTGDDQPPGGGQVENCAVVGDEDGNGLADCLDPACVNEPKCATANVPPGCGNNKLEAGEACDDGNAVDGDGCDHNCTMSVCGNGVMAGTETCDDGNAVDGDGCDHNCTITACGNGVVTGTEACDDGNANEWDGCTSACTASIATYIKASNTGGGDDHGSSVALSADGNTLAVGAEFEDSAATGVNGDQASNAAPGSGAVYVYVRAGSTWVQQAYVKASNPNKDDHFGISVALSADGSTLAVGATGEDSASGADPASNAVSASGAVYVFARTGTAWAQQAYVKASNPGVDDQFGSAVALSGDGATLAVGAVSEDSAATGIGGDEADDNADDAGAAYVFTRTDATWTQQAYIKAANAGEGDNFGASVALSNDGATLAVGADLEDSGKPDDATDDSAPLAGAAYVFTRTGATWSQQAYVKQTEAAAGENLGDSVSLAADGDTLAVGAGGAANATGRAFVFTRAAGVWTELVALKASNDRPTNLFFGQSVALSADGKRLAVGAHGEGSKATGVGGDQNDSSAALSGAVYSFALGTTWTQLAYVKASNTGAGDFFGTSVALSGNGATLAVGAPLEDSSATGIGGTQGDDTAEAGAVYVFQ
jgi:cysteine-rich repeat protein